MSSLLLRNHIIKLKVSKGSQNRKFKRKFSQGVRNLVDMIHLRMGNKIINAISLWEFQSWDSQQLYPVTQILDAHQEVATSMCVFTQKHLCCILNQAEFYVYSLQCSHTPECSSWTQRLNIRTMYVLSAFLMTQAFWFTLGPSASYL